MTAACGGIAVEEHELEHPEPQRGEHGGLEPLDAALGERLDHVVERRPALDDAVREAHRERAVARVERGGLAMQRLVRIGSVLEHAPDDRVGAHAGTRDVRDLTARVSLS